MIFKTNWMVFEVILLMLAFIQWNLDLMKCWGTGEIWFLNRGLFILNSSIERIFRKTTKMLIPRRGLWTYTWARRLYKSIRWSSGWCYWWVTDSCCSWRWHCIKNKKVLIVWLFTRRKANKGKSSSLIYEIIWTRTWFKTRQHESTRLGRCKSGGRGAGLHPYVLSSRSARSQLRQPVYGRFLFI